MKDLVKRAARDLAESKYAIALTGAGISTESGIPDFRGPKGMWTANKEAEAKAYERYDLFLNDPKAYWEELLGLRGIYGTFREQIRQAQPNPGHYALADLEALGILKCVITQNIDGLHKKAGSKRVLEYHGSVNAVRCISCGSRFPWDEISPDELPPRCHKCGAALKDDVVHFKEPIPSDVMDESEEEALSCDLVLICGTSAVVYPFANLPRIARYHASSLILGSDIITPKTSVKIIEVNADPTPLTHEGISDYLVQGKTGEILPTIVEEVKKSRKT